MAMNNIGEILSDQGGSTRPRTSSGRAGHRRRGRTPRALDDESSQSGPGGRPRRPLRRGGRAARGGRGGLSRDPCCELRAGGACAIAEAAVLAGDHERALREADSPSSPASGATARASRVAAPRPRYAYLQLRAERRRRTREFEQSIEAARDATRCTSWRSRSAPRRSFAGRPRRTARRSVSWTPWRSFPSRTSRQAELLGARARTRRAPSEMRYLAPPQGSVGRMKYDRRGRRW